MSFERYSFPRGLTAFELAKAIAIGMMSRKTGESIEQLMQSAQRTSLPEGNYDLTPIPLRRWRFRYNLAVLDKNHAIFTKTLNPDRIHTPLDRLRDAANLLLHGGSTVVSRRHLPPHEMITVPTGWDRYINDVLGNDRSQRTYEVVFYHPERNDDSERQFDVPRPGVLLPVS